MKKYLFLLAIVIFAFGVMSCSSKDTFDTNLMPAKTGFVMVKDGVANSSIILDKDANAVEKYAADALFKYVKEISGAELPIVSEATNGNNIYIGRGESVKGLLKGFNWNQFKLDGIYIRCNGTNRLVLTGAEGSATIYSVYTLLEECFGVKYILPEEDYIPKSKTLVVGECNYLYNPPFFSRESFISLGRWNKYAPDSNLKQKQNGNNKSIPQELGGNQRLNGFAHTFMKLVPPEKYGKDHPEWFSYRDGKRLLGDTQLCLSNKEMVKELTKNVLETIKNSPNDTIFSVTQFDNQYYCECDKCKALSEKYGHSGALLTVINEVAKEVKKQYPDKFVETFAYQYTQPAPKGGIKPADNVIIRLCSIEADFAHPFDDPGNKAFMGDLKAWASISNQLYIWDYAADFANYIIPFPNTQVLQRNCQILAQNKVVAYMNEGDFQNDTSWFLPYKNYILAKLSWNPNIDVDKESKTFFKLYYGSAGDTMYKYLKYCEKITSASDVYLRENREDINYWTAENLIEGCKLLNKALDQTKNDQKYYDRVYTDLLCHTAAVYASKGSVMKEVQAAKVLKFDRKTFYTELVDWSKKVGMNYAKEGTLMENSFYVSINQKQTGVKPVECENIPDANWTEFSGDSLPRTAGQADAAKLVDDPKAPNKKAKWFNAKYPDWWTQFKLAFLNSYGEFSKAEVYIKYRVEPGQKVGKAYTVGVYSNTDKYLMQKDIMNNETPDGNYKTEKLGELDLDALSPDTYMWIAGTEESMSTGLYVDSIFFIFK